MITFLGMPSRTSGEIRGRQMTEAIGGTACFVDVHSVDFNIVAKNKTALFVRTWEPAVAAELKRRGHRIGYEIADMPVGDAFFRGAEVVNFDAYTHPECDFFVVNNAVQRDDVFLSLESKGMANRHVRIIPHHSTNFHGAAAQFNTIPKRVGYVGLPEQLTCRDEIETVCAKHNVEFISVHPRTREECDEVFRSLDVGVVFADSNATMRPRVVDLMKRYKPNTKLTNFQAYGIPAVCTPYESYLEHGRNPETDGGVVFVDDKAAMLAALEQLLVDRSLRMTMGQRAFEHGKHFHINEIKRMYEDL